MEKEQAVTIDAVRGKLFNAQAHHYALSKQLRALKRQVKEAEQIVDGLVNQLGILEIQEAASKALEQKPPPQAAEPDAPK